MNTICDLTVPVKTVSESNTRGHWAVRARRVKGQRGAAKALTQAALPGGPLPARLKIVLTRIAPGELDKGDNLNSSLKAVRDGVADALGIDDGDVRLSWTYRQRRPFYDEPRYLVHVVIIGKSEERSGK